MTGGSYLSGASLGAAITFGVLAADAMVRTAAVAETLGAADDGGV